MGKWKTTRPAGFPYYLGEADPKAKKKTPVDPEHPHRERNNARRHELQDRASVGQLYRKVQAFLDSLRFATKERKHLVRTVTRTAAGVTDDDAARASVRLHALNVKATAKRQQLAAKKAAKKAEARYDGWAPGGLMYGPAARLRQRNRTARRILTGRTRLLTDAQAAVQTAAPVS